MSTSTFAHSAFQRVTARRPCTLCGKSHGCVYDPVQGIVICMRTPSERYVTAWSGYLHFVPPSPQEVDDAARIRTEPDRKPLDAATARARDALYGALAAHPFCQLSPQDREDLRGRGLSDEAIQRHGFFTYPDASGRGQVLRDLEDRASLSIQATLEKTREGYTFAPPKSARSRRQVALTPTAVAALRRHRARQATERLAAGTAWQDRGLVFTNESGQPLNGIHVLRYEFLPLLKRAGLPRVRFHDLRHSCATLLLGRGVNPKIVSELLGHSTVAITLDLYSHVLPTMQEAAASALEAALGNG